MTGQFSVSQSLGRSRRQNTDGKPRPGTKLRATYDALRRGEKVSDNIETLKTFYGMDISCGRLIGEWEGPYYVKAERIICSELQ